MSVGLSMNGGQASVSPVGDLLPAKLTADYLRVAGSSLGAGCHGARQHEHNNAERRHRVHCAAMPRGNDALN